MENECNSSKFHIQNACGIIFVCNKSASHISWKRTKSIFGYVHKAFTTAGNFILQDNKISFKGSYDPTKLRDIIKSIIPGPFNIHLQLVVASIGIGRCLRVYVNCALESALRRVAWARVMGRIEEICNVVVFYVTNWRSMESALQLEPWHQIPRSCTVSVTRRGTMTIRLTWQSRQWTSNKPFEIVTYALARFVRNLI